MSTEAKTPQTLLSAMRHFTPDVAREYVARIKWPDGPCCVKCGSVNVGTIASRGRVQCREKGCRAQTSLIAGTIMEGTHLRLDQWIVGLWMIVNCRNGVSSCEIARTIGCKQQSAWHLLHRARHVLKPEHTEQMSGTVEADCTFVGGLFKFMNHKRWDRARRSRRPKGKSVVHALLCRETGEVRAGIVHREGRAHTEPMIRKHVAPGSHLFTDNGGAFKWARYAGEYRHQSVNHGFEYVRGSVHVNGLECFFNTLRRGLKGTYIAARPEHLAAYVDEQVYRFNNRKETDWQRFERAMRLIVGKRLTYSELTSGAVR